MTAHAARYLALAERLRQKIRSGVLPPGALLPSEEELRRDECLSRPTVRAALDELRREGLIETRAGRGSWVRTPPPVRRLGSDRYRRHVSGDGGTPFTRDHGVDWSACELEREFRDVPAPVEVASLFGIAPGTMLLRRDFLFRAHGYPQQMSSSFLLLEMVGGTPVADPDREPWPGGTIAQLASLGVEVESPVQETVRSRMPTGVEMARLQIPSGVPVIAITRRMLSGGRPVEVAADIVIPADRAELAYELPIL